MLFMPYKDDAETVRRARQWALDHPERAALAHRRGRWKAQGMNPDKAQAVYESTSHCEICGDAVRGKRKHVNHNKETGFARGVLCDDCNHLLGYAKEDIRILQQASEYLTRKIRRELAESAEAIGAPSYVSFDGKG